MYNLENYLVQYATFNWQHLYIDLKSYKDAIIITFLILFVLIFLLNWICNFGKSKKTSSKSIQTDDICNDIKTSKITVTETGEFLLESIFNHKFFRNHIFNCWIDNYNEFHFSKIISKNCRIIEFNPENCEQFYVTQIRTIESRELVTFTFQLKCKKLLLTIGVINNDKEERQAQMIMSNIEFSALVMIRISEIGLLLKFFPDCVCDLNCQLVADNIDVGEIATILAEFRRDFKLVMLQTLDMEWMSPNNGSSDDNNKADFESVNQQYQVSNYNGNNNFIDNVEINTSSSQSYENIEVVGEKAIIYHPIEQYQLADNSNVEKTNVKELMSRASLFTTDSYDFYDQGEESPFHDRVSSKLVGRTLVVGLIKVVEAQELRNPLKSGYCVLELDEPYQRHVSHLISLIEYPIWNQHFVFSLNSNSQRLSVELFHASKKCQNPTSLGVAVIPISLIIVDPSENYFPINNNQIGSRKSWRCDVIAGGVDSKIPAFLIEFQIMKNIHDINKTPADPSSDLSSNNSAVSIPLENAVKLCDNNDLDQDSVHKMQTIPEAQTPDNTLTKMRSNSDTKNIIRDKPNNENVRSKSVIRKIRHRFSQLSVPWMSEKSKSDDCLDQLSDDHETQIPVQPPAELFMITSKPKFFTKLSDVDLSNSRSLSTSLKKVFNIPTKKFGKSDQFKEKSLEQLFKEMDPKLFDTISNEGFNRIMNNK